MRVRIGYDIHLDFVQPTAAVFILNVHPSQSAALEAPDLVRFDPVIPAHLFHDAFGNPCVRVLAPAGRLKVSTETIIRDGGEPEPWPVGIAATPPAELPDDTLQFLLPSRYCEVESLSDAAWSLFGHLPSGWPQVEAILNWCKANVTFGYAFARHTKTAVDVYYERKGVCRDFMHLAITFCRALNIPARYATGYLGDIGVPISPAPMDFSAYFQVYLGGQWWNLDARHNQRRIARVMQAYGRDAADVAILTSFGPHKLAKFFVITDELKD